jgi:hypothetical protein
MEEVPVAVISETLKSQWFSWKIQQWTSGFKISCLIFSANLRNLLDTRITSLIVLRIVNMDTKNHHVNLGGATSSSLLPKANECTYVDFGCTHQIDRSLTIYLLSFFSKYECWVTDLIMPRYHFILLSCHLLFCITKFHITMKYIKKLIWLIFKMKFLNNQFERLC